jgi:hypothetical protein
MRRSWAGKPRAASFCSATSFSHYLVRASRSPGSQIAWGDRDPGSVGSDVEQQGGEWPDADDVIYLWEGTSITQMYIGLRHQKHGPLQRVGWADATLPG